MSYSDLSQKNKEQLQSLIEAYKFLDSNIKENFQIDLTNNYTRWSNQRYVCSMLLKGKFGLDANKILANTKLEDLPEITTPDSKTQKTIYDNLVKKEFEKLNWNDFPNIKNIYQEFLKENKLVLELNNKINDLEKQIQNLNAEHENYMKSLILTSGAKIKNVNPLIPVPMERSKLYGKPTSSINLEKQSIPSSNKNIPMKDMANLSLPKHESAESWEERAQVLVDKINYCNELKKELNKHEPLTDITLTALENKYQKANDGTFSTVANITKKIRDAMPEDQKLMHRLDVEIDKLNSFIDAENKNGPPKGPLADWRRKQSEDKVKMWEAKLACCNKLKDGIKENDKNKISEALYNNTKDTFSLITKGVFSTVDSIIKDAKKLYTQISDNPEPDSKNNADIEMSNFTSKR